MTIAIIALLIIGLFALFVWACALAIYEFLKK